MRSLNFFNSNSRMRGILSERKSGLQFFIYNLSGNALTLLMNFILPLYITAAGYGTFALLYSLYNLFAAIFTFGLSSSILKFSLDKEERPNLVAQCFFVWVILSSLSFVLIMPITWFCSAHNILKVPFSAAIITILSAILISFQRIMLYYYIAKSERKKYGQLFIFNKVVQFAFFVLVVIIFTEKKSIEWMPFIFLLQSVITVLLILFLERKEYSFYLPKKKEIKSLTKFTLPLTLETFGNLGYSYGFNLLISPFLSLSQSGVLNIYTQLGSIVSMTSNALNNGYLPKFFLNVESKFIFTVNKYFKYIMMNGSIISIGVFFLGILYKFFAKSVDDDYSIILLLIYLFGIFVYLFKAIGSSYLIIQSKTMRISIITIVSSGLTILIGVISTHIWGFTGCIFSLSIGYVIQVLFFNFDTIKRVLIEKKN